MNTYEFWNDMDKIFDAIVAYQEKTIEFNKQFVNPWIKLGKVFDKHETNDAVVAHKNAVEIDPDNPQNWHELATAHTRAGNFDEAIQAYQKAIELGFKSGELYKNLALAHVMIGQYQASIAIFQKSLELLEKDEEKAVVWNHLGNVYRKVDDYEMALQAFQQADQYEHKAQAGTTTSSEELTEEVVIPTDELDASQPTDEPAPVIEDVSTTEDIVAAPAGEETAFTDEDLEVELNEQQEEVEKYVDEAVGEADEEEENDDDMPVILELDFSEDSPNPMMENTRFAEEQPSTEFLVASENEVAEVPLQAEMTNEELQPEVKGELEVSFEALAVVEQASEPLHHSAGIEDGDEDAQAVEPEEEISFAIAQNSADLTEEVEDEAEEGFEEDGIDAEDEEFDASDNEEENVDVAPPFLVYDEYMKDNIGPDSEIINESEAEETQTIAMAPAEVEVTNSDVSMDANTDLTVEMDTKNAHIWNELGNVYFNAGSFDDAIAAYSKAIELDKQFAWPYTNLALSYVQKGRLEEAVSLYQRSIELFSNENDKAVTWNRLGNVYRRMNDYEKAIAAYQRADELDPGSVAINQQARFSLLGSEKVGQEVSYSV